MFNCIVPAEGIVDYVENGRTISFWCRPTYIPNTFIYIYRPFPESWKNKHAWALDRKEEITTLALDYIRTKFPPSIVEFVSDASIMLRADEDAT